MLVLANAHRLRFLSRPKPNISNSPSTNKSVNIAGDASPSPRQQGTNAGTDGGKQNFKQEPRASHRKRQANAQVQIYFSKQI